VEHCVTELAANIDIVKEQIRIAAGERLSYDQEDVKLNAHAIECRINAEDATRNFFPSPGTVKQLRLPHGLGVRIDEGIYEGYEVPYDYDSLLLKLMVRGKTRDETIARMQRALDEMRIAGMETNILFHQVALEDEAFKSGDYTTEFITTQKIAEKVQERARILRKLDTV